VTSAAVEGLLKRSSMHAGIKAIKLYAWEEPYEKRIQVARTAERQAIFKMQDRSRPLMPFAYCPPALRASGSSRRDVLSYWER
jgi:hypothetical protein